MLGAGGMASVYRARDRQLNRLVAVKVISHEVGTPAELQRQQSEAHLLASLNHHSLVTLFDAVITDGRAYLVMELVEGPTLRERLQAGPLSEQAVGLMALDLAEALQFIHSRGIVHRDVKPANVLLAPSSIPGRAPIAKLADFGIARLSESVGVTVPGSVMGTAHYLSPEQARGERVQAPSDIYSLGLTLLEAMTGATAFPGTVLESVTARLIRDPVVPGWIPGGWRALLIAMTARDPEGRPSALVVLERARTLSSAVAPTDREAEPTGATITHRLDAAELPTVPVPRIAGSDTTEETAHPTLLLESASAPTVARPVSDQTPTVGRMRRFRLEGPRRAVAIAAGALLLLVALVSVLLIHPSPPAASLPALPGTSAQLRNHLQQLLESVTR